MRNSEFQLGIAFILFQLFPLIPFHVRLKFRYNLHIHAMKRELI